MKLETVRKIRGNLHGSIDISEIEDRVIAHPYFQRLRRIRQTAFLSYAFPGATHTRFEHSIGVLHMATKAWDKIKNNQTRLNASIKKYPNFTQMENNPDTIKHGSVLQSLTVIEDIFEDTKIWQTMRLAALLHDIGHPPFSHSGEMFLPTTIDFLKDSSLSLPPYIAEYLQGLDQKLKGKGLKEQERLVSHEFYTLMIADKMLREILAEHPNQLGISPQDVLSVINPEIVPENGSALNKYKANIFCNELVSGELDVDRMDYLLRDSRESGVVYGIFDAERIVDSLGFYYDPKTLGIHVCLFMSGLSAFEDYLRARQSMYMQLYFHKSSVGAEAMLGSLNSCLRQENVQWAFPKTPEAYTKIDENNIYQVLRDVIEDRISEPSETKKWVTLLDDLLLNRRLWKRVFEITHDAASFENSGDNSDDSIANEKSPSPDNEAINQLSLAQNLLEELGCEFQVISSKVELSKFYRFRETQTSGNYIRIIKKDKRQFPRVERLEKFSQLIKGDRSKKITRIYVNPGEKEGMYRKARDLLLKSIE